MIRVRDLLARLLKRYIVAWSATTAIIYFVMIPLSIWLFPRTTILLTVMVLFGGFTASIASLASVLIDAEQDTEIDELEARP